MYSLATIAGKLLSGTPHAPSGSSYFSLSRPSAPGPIVGMERGSFFTSLWDELSGPVARSYRQQAESAVYTTSVSSEFAPWCSSDVSCTRIRSVSWWLRYVTTGGSSVTSDRIVSPSSAFSVGLSGSSQKEVGPRESDRSPQPTRRINFGYSRASSVRRGSIPSEHLVGRFPGGLLVTVPWESETMHGRRPLVQMF